MPRERPRGAAHAVVDPEAGGGQPVGRASIAFTDGSPEIVAVGEGPLVSDARRHAARNARSSCASKPPTSPTRSSDARPRTLRSVAGAPPPSSAWRNAPLSPPVMALSPGPRHRSAEGYRGAFTVLAGLRRRLVPAFRLACGGRVPVRPLRLAVSRSLRVRRTDGRRDRSSPLGGRDGDGRAHGLTGLAMLAMCSGSSGALED